MFSLLIFRKSKLAHLGKSNSSSSYAELFKNEPLLQRSETLDKRSLPPTVPRLPAKKSATITPDISPSVSPNISPRSKARFVRQTSISKTVANESPPVSDPRKNIKVNLRRATSLSPVITRLTIPETKHRRKRSSLSPPKKRGESIIDPPKFLAGLVQAPKEFSESDSKDSKVDNNSKSAARIAMKKSNIKPEERTSQNVCTIL